MTSRPARAPGLAFEVVPPPAEISPLRSDVAAFVGATRRGPVGTPVRVEGWREYVKVFGDLDRDLDTTYAIRGYFENGGQVAWILRIAAPGAALSKTEWASSGLAALGPSKFRVWAATPGQWSRGARVTFRYRGRSAIGKPTVDVSIRTTDEREEHRAIPAEALVDYLAAASKLIALEDVGPIASTTPRAFAVEEVVLDNAGIAAPPQLEDYFAAIDLLEDLPEVAIIAFPAVQELGEVAAARVFRTAASAVDALHDRLVLVDLPHDAPKLRWQTDDILKWVSDVLGRDTHDLAGAERWWRSAALYHPWLRVLDPLGGVAAPTRDVAPSGHVAGVISQLDRERGAFETPANSPMLGVIDLREDYTAEEHAVLNPEGVDLIRCAPSIGFSIWGGRTLDRTSRFVAHRRLVHRLVRAIRRVAEPLVFETNGPILWFTFVRAVTAVLIEAWRSGALAGTRPEEAFDVTCNEATNPPEQVDVGICICEIKVAPAVPMEFILIRVALDRDGALEVLP